MAILLLLLLRIVMATSAHPRIALITSTMKHAITDLFHFFLIFAVIFAGFALVGSWRFGSELDTMGTWSGAFKAQIDMMLGPPGLFQLSSEAGEKPAFFVY